MAHVQDEISKFLSGAKHPLVVILGPTASGKTPLSLDLAAALHGEIISADSRQVYRGMDIGTAKITDQRGIPHHMIDVVDPDKSFTVAHYKEQAEQAIDDIHARGKVPFLVGGTMLYIDAVTKNLQIPAGEPDERLRADLEAQTNEQLTEQLRELDPECADEIDQKNKRRLVRALEYCLQTREKFSEARKEGPSNYESLLIGLDVSREELYRRIDQRVDEQVASGLVEETKRLADKFGYDIPSMSSLGYRQVGMYLRGECELADAVQRIKFDTHAYARRQMTWWRGNSRIIWVQAH